MPNTEYGLFIKEDYNYDYTTLFKNELSNDVSMIANVLNKKVSGYYTLDEFITGEQWYEDPTLSSTTTQRPTKRPITLKVIPLGALPNAAGTKTVAHGITFLIPNTFTFTSIQGTANDRTTPKFCTLPYASGVAADAIEVWVDGTNVNITVGKDQSSFTDCSITLKYIKY